LTQHPVPVASSRFPGPRPRRDCPCRNGQSRPWLDLAGQGAHLARPGPRAAAPGTGRRDQGP
jgi:hypothetical protein